MQIVIFSSAIEKTDGGGTVCRLRERVRLAGDHLVRIGRRRIGLREDCGKANQGRSEHPKEPGGVPHKGS